jgi:TIR domain/SIR2-like domain
MEPLSVFISYSHADDELRQALERSLASLKLERLIRPWDDRQIVSGTDWEQQLDSRLETADIVLLLVSNDFLSSPYCIGREATRAVERHLQGTTRVVPILLRPSDWRRAPIGSGTTQKPLGLFQALPRDSRFVTSETWKDRDAAFLQIAEGVREVVLDIVSRREVASTPPALAAPDERASGPDQISIGRLLNLFASENITFFVGGGLTVDACTGPARACDIALHLLEKLQLVQPGWDKLLPPVDTVATYFAVKEGALTLENRVLEFISSKDVVASDIHAVIAGLVAAAGNMTARAITQLRPQFRQQQLIVTTNVDLMMERALLRQGLSFTRIVQHHGIAPRIDVTRYPAVSATASHVEVQWPAQTSGAPPSVLRIAIDDVKALDAFISGEPSVIFKHDASVAAAAAGPIGSQNVLESLPVRTWTAPILYKLRGSLDVARSCALSTDQYIDFCTRRAGAFVPVQIKEIVSQTPGVFVGYGFLEPDFRLLYHTFEAGLVDRDVTSLPLYALQLPPHRESRDNYRLMEVDLWEALKETGPRRARIVTIEQEARTYLQDLLKRVG